MRRLPLLILFSIFALAATNRDSCAMGDRYAIIVCGSGGEEEYQQKFSDWGKRLASVSKSWLGTKSDAIVLLQENSQNNNLTATLTNIENTFQVLSSKLTPEDELFVFLIGHGSFVRNESKFLIPGPDLTAETLKTLLSSLTVQMQVVLNGSSSSAGFINVLSGPNRIVCTATKSADETNAAEFMEFFLQGLEQNLADRDRDQRITFLDACRYASNATLQWYEKNGFIATEHALIDDNGDGLGERLASDESNKPHDSIQAGSDGYLVSQLILVDRSFPKSAPKEKVNEYLSLLNQVKNLKKKKNELDEKIYYQQLESLLIKAALIHRDILEYKTEPAPETTISDDFFFPPWVK